MEFEDRLIITNMDLLRTDFTDGAEGYDGFGSFHVWAETSLKKRHVG